MFPSSVVRRCLPGLATLFALAVIPPAAAADAAPWQVANVAPLSKAMYELAFSPSSKAVYVASTGGFTEGATGQVFKLDPDSLAIEKSWPLPGQAFGMALDDTRHVLYLGDTLAQSVMKLDLNSGKVQTLKLVADQPEPAEGEEKPFGPNPRQLVLSPEGNTLYISGVGTKSVLWTVDTDSMTLADTLPGFGEWATGLALDAAHHRLFVSTYKDNAIRVVDTRTHQIVDQWPTGGKSPLNLAFDPESQQLYVTHAKSQAVTVLDTTSGRQTAAIDLGGDSLAARLDPKAHQLLVTQRDAHALAIIDTRTNTVTQRLDMALMPNSLALTPQGKTAWMTNKAPIHKEGETYVSNVPDQVIRLSLTP